MGVCTFLGARPWGQRGAEQQQQPKPQEPAPLHGAGPGPGTVARTAEPGGEDWGGARQAEWGWGAGLAPGGAESWPHLDHLLKGTVGQEGNLLDR